MGTYRCSSSAATERAGESLGYLVKAGDSIGLIGDLGAGKTLFVQGLARGLGVPERIRVTSPTFTIVNEYRGGRHPLYHVDLYRIERAVELDELGLDELGGGQGVIAVEWCERFDVLPSDHLEIRIEIAGDEERALTVRGRGPRSQELAKSWFAALAGA